MIVAQELFEVKLKHAGEASNWMALVYIGGISADGRARGSFKD